MPPSRSRSLTIETKTSPRPRRYRLLGTSVDALGFDESLSRIAEIVERRIPTQHVVLNAFKVVTLQKDPRLAAIIESCDLINADGTGVVWAARLLGVPVPERVTGIDLMRGVLKLAGQRKWRVFFFGSHLEVAEETARWAERTFPGLQVAGFRSGYFSASDSPAIVRQIADSRSDILLVALPSPLKEYWLHQHINELRISLGMGVGGSFEVVTGRRRRAPRWVQKAGLEWLFRFLQEPRRMWRRYVPANARFVWLVLRKLVAGKRLSARPGGTGSVGPS